MAFPALWVFWEWLRSVFLFGFPWLFLGYSQVHSPLKGFGPIFGVYGISLIVTFISGCIYLLFSAEKVSAKIANLIFIILPFIVGGILTFTSWTKVQKSLRVELVQGNIGQHLKWNISNFSATLLTYYTETQKNWSRDIIVWPEAAIPIYPQRATFFLRSLNKKYKQHHIALITGIPIYHEKTQEVFNGLMVLGEGKGLYLKQHLVPFGEAFPSPRFFSALMKYFDIPMSNLTPGPKSQKPTFAKNIPFAPFICYEIAYPTEVLNGLLSNKQFIVVISDDSWFDGSIALAQQLQIAQMRALEMNRYMLYCTNTGITAIINPQGKIVKTIPKNKLTTLMGEIKSVTGKTPLMRLHYYPVFGTIILFLTIAAFV